jgi:tripeptidyl-peptidase-1
MICAPFYYYLIVVFKYKRLFQLIALHPTCSLEFKGTSTDYCLSMHPFASVLVFFSVVLAGPSKRADHVLHERRVAEPVAWATRRLEADKVIPLRIGLKQQNMDRLEDLLLSVSHPDSPMYGQHWTPARVAEFFSPHDDTIVTVTDWLAEYGLTGQLSRSKGWLDVEMTVDKAEELLGADYHVYSHESGIEQIGVNFSFD